MVACRFACRERSIGGHRGILNERVIAESYSRQAALEQKNVNSQPTTPCVCFAMFACKQNNLACLQQEKYRKVPGTALLKAAIAVLHGVCKSGPSKSDFSAAQPYPPQASLTVAWIGVPADRAPQGAFQMPHGWGLDIMSTMNAAALNPKE